MTVLSLAFYAAASSRAQGSVGAIEGVVRDTAGAPVSEVSVAIRGTVLRAVTDTRGRYRIDGVSLGLVTLDARRLFFRSMSRDSVTVTGGTVTRADFVAAPAGVGFIRDRATWDAVWRRFGNGRRTVPRDSARVDWNREMVLLLSYGSGLAELEEHWGFNRAEVRDGALVIALGPDSLVGKPELFVDGTIFPDAIAMPRSDLTVRCEKRVDDGWIPPVVDWRVVASAPTPPAAP